MKHVIEVSFNDLETAEGISASKVKLVELFYAAVYDRLTLTAFESETNTEGASPTFFGAPVEISIKKDPGG